jgi:TolB-like protein
VLAWLSAIALSTVLLAGAPSTESDTSGPRIAVLPVQYAGDLDEHWRVELQKRLLDGLVRGRFSLVPPTEVAAAKGFDPKCASVKCYAAIATHADAKYILRTRVAKEDRDYRVSIEVIDPADGDVIASTTERCNLCGASEVGEIAGVQAAVLRRKLDELVLGPPVLLLESSPTRANVLLDGQPIGSTPLRHVLTPGKHVVRVGKDGHGWQERSFGAVAGVEEQLSITLTPIARQWKPKARKWGWALLSIGGAAIVSGAVLIAIDERPYQRRCDGNDVDPLGNCRFTYDTLAGGIAALASGVVLAATGTGLAVAGRNRNERSSTRAAASRKFRLATPIVLGR